MPTTKNISTIGDKSPINKDVTGNVNIEYDTVNFYGINYQFNLNTNIGLEHIEDNQYIGRKELVAKLKSILTDDNPESKFLVLQSMGGVGKTYLTKYLSSLTLKDSKEVGHFYHTIFVQCATTNNSKSSVEDYLFTLFKSSIYEPGVDVTSITDDKKEPFIKAVLASLKKPILLILDDINHEFLEENQISINKYILNDKDNRTLASTRDNNIDNEGILVTQLDFLTLDEAFELFKLKSNNIILDDVSAITVKNIIKQVDNHTLLVTLLAKYTKDIAKKGKKLLDIEQDIINLDLSDMNLRSTQGLNYIQNEEQTTYNIAKIMDYCFK
jgi:NB-ARC domain